MEKFLAYDADYVRKLCQIGVYDYVIVGSGFGGGILADQLVKQKKKVLLIERGGATFTTHLCNTARPDFARGTNNSVEGNETVYNTIKERVQTAEGSDPYVGGPVYCLGGRSSVWGLWIPRVNKASLDQYFPADVSHELQTYAYSRAFDLLTNYSQSEVYPIGDIHLNIKDLDEAKKNLTALLQPIIAPDEEVEIGPIATELNSPAVYRFPMGGYSTVTPLLNRIYARDQYLTVLMDTEVIQFDYDQPDAEGERQVKGLTVRTKGSGQVHWLNTAKATVILSAGTIGTPTIALNSGLQFINPLVGKGLMDHEIYYVRIDIERTDDDPTEPLNLQCVVKLGTELALLTVTINANFFLAGSSTIQTSQYWSADGHLLNPDHKALAEKKFDTIAILVQFGAELDDNNEVLGLPTPDPVIRVRRPISHNGLLQKEMQAVATDIRNGIVKDIIHPGFDFGEKGAGAPAARWHPFAEDVPSFTLLGFGVFSHETGTMRMKGPDNKPGVVDTNLKVDGFKDLYVCDLSVLPYSPPANPTLTLTALTLRLAENLLGENVEVR
ncbi:hypothetical protein FN846DRAFT_189185 [Sphaerosporella brunnea]|uniref:Glucose-methanol-choline oxidoreductase C-terminal domain-containing protein n=1 Tax=Sphaerosporella brunnea TaxID=1250544 RepID=A0A5J5EPW5_9PEZI|nr:hypothetical protein FN846DRAFT_189185 [Sphaerosporella brunnea]